MSELDVKAIGAKVPRADESARTAARARQGALAKPPGSLGRLEDISVWLCGVQGTCPPRPLAQVRLVLFAGDHGIAQAGVSAYPPELTAQLLATIVAGEGAANALARLAGVAVRVVDMAVDSDPPEQEAGQDPPESTRWKVRRSTGRLDVEDAMTREEAEAAFRAGMDIADLEVDEGADLLLVGDVGIGSTTPAAVITGLLLRLDAATVMGRGTGIDDATWMRKCAAVRDGIRRARPSTGDPIGLLARVGGPDVAAMAGLLLQAAVRRTPVVLDGVLSGAAALLVQRCGYRAVDWWIAGHRSPEPAHAKALERLALEPLLDYGMRLGEGTGALLALPILRAAQATLSEMAMF